MLDWTRRMIRPDSLFAIAFVICGIAIWWFTARDLPAFVLPTPPEVAGTMSRFFTDYSLTQHLLISAFRVFSALLFTLILAVCLAAAAHRYQTIRMILERRILVFLNSFPSVGWAILGVIWFQISNATVVFIQSAIILPFMLISAMAAFAQLDPELEEMGRSFNRNPLVRFRKLTLPLMMPVLMSGVRVAYGICWKIALVAELFGAQSGLGYLLMRAQSSADASMVFAVCLMIVISVITVDRLILNPIAKHYSVNKGATA